MDKWSKVNDFSKQRLCRGHYTALSIINPGLRAALLDTDINLEWVTSRVHDHAFGDTSCVPCQDRCNTEESILCDRLAEWIRESWTTDLLCLPHLSSVGDKISSTDMKELLAAQEGKLNQMTKDLQDFINTHDYRFPGPPPEGPNAPYRWALAFLTAKPSLASPVLHESGFMQIYDSMKTRSMKMRSRT